MTLLSKPAILRHMKSGSIVIDPFKTERLGTNSYDVELGHWFWRHSENGGVRRPSEGGFAFTKFDARQEGGIVLEPGERVLGHTVEIVGGRVAETRVETGQTKRVAVTTAMHAKSTAGRHGLTVCQCAGWGDVGYVSRWTLEIQNQLSCSQWLPVGALLAQISFEEVEPPGKDYVALGGMYQVGDDWTPEAMLPGDLKVA
jgi:dCTP deaminase